MAESRFFLGLLDLLVGLKFIPSTGGYKHVSTDASTSFVISLKHFIVLGRSLPGRERLGYSKEALKKIKESKILDFGREIANP